MKPPSTDIAVLVDGKSFSMMRDLWPDGMSQLEKAEALDAYQPYVCVVDKRHPTCMSIPMLLRYAKACGYQLEIHFRRSS